MSILSSFIAEGLPTAEAPALSQHTVIEHAASVSATAKFIAKFLPSAEASFANSSHIERDAKDARAEITPDRTPFLQRIYSLDSGPKTPEGQSLFESIRSQPLKAPSPPAGALYVITSVIRSPDVTWVTRANRSTKASATGTVKVATGDIKGDASFNGSNEAHYKGAPMVVSVVMRRIGKDGSVIRFDETTHGPEVVVAD